jgi:hypothetical protein
MIWLGIKHSGSGEVWRGVVKFSDGFRGNLWCMLTARVREKRRQWGSKAIWKRGRGS